MKKLLSLTLVLILLGGLGGTTVSAASQEVSPYEEVLISINEEFDLDLGYIPVDESEVSLEEYEQTTRKLAIQQRELLDYIDMREKQSSNSETLMQSKDYTVLSTSTKTRTKDVWNYGSYFSITATYDVNGIYLSSLRNAQLNQTTWAKVTNTFASNLSSPSYSIIDGGRTGTVRFTGNLHFNSTIPYGNVTFYTEFYYND